MLAFLPQSWLRSSNIFYSHVLIIQIPQDTPDLSFFLPLKYFFSLYASPINLYVLFPDMTILSRASTTFFSTLLPYSIVLSTFFFPLFHPSGASYSWGICSSFLLANPCHSFQSYTIFLTYLTSKPLLFKKSFSVSIHYFCSRPNELLSTHSPHILLTIQLYPNFLTLLNHWRISSSVLSFTPFGHSM